MTGRNGRDPVCRVGSPEVERTGRTLTLVGVGLRGEPRAAVLGVSVDGPQTKPRRGQHQDPEDEQAPFRLAAQRDEGSEQDREDDRGFEDDTSVGRGEQEVVQRFALGRVGPRCLSARGSR